MSDARSGWTESTNLKVLVVDDEQNLVELVGRYLRAEGFTVLEARDGLQALEVARSEQPALLVLDVMLPGLDGIEVCRRLRTFSDAYVLMLTARSEEIDKIIGLSVGADDYLTKPFSPRELVARVKAMLRRPRGTVTSTGPGPTILSTGATSLGREPDTPPPLLFDDLSINPGSHEVTLRGEPVHLTPREFDLLLTLASHPGRVFTRDQLLSKIWGDEYYDDHTVDVHVTHLRRKLEDDASRPQYIETVRSVGYRFAKRIKEKG